MGRHKTFETSLKQSEGKKPYSFYDGPPFATGLPHYGHILAGTMKDVVTRYAHQTGHFVERRFGWDCFTKFTFFKRPKIGESNENGKKILFNHSIKKTKKSTLP